MVEPKDGGVPAATSEEEAGPPWSAVMALFDRKLLEAKERLVEEFRREVRLDREAFRLRLKEVRAQDFEEAEIRHRALIREECTKQLGPEVSQIHVEIREARVALRDAQEGLDRAMAFHRQWQRSGTTAELEVALNGFLLGLQQPAAAAARSRAARSTRYFARRKKLLRCPSPASIPFRPLPV